MKKIATAVFLLLQISVLHAATPKECSFCAGVVTDLKTTPAVAVPLLLRAGEADLAAIAPAIDALTPEQRSKLTLVVSYDVAGTDPLTDVETHTKTIIDWAKLRGPFDAIGIDAKAPSAEAAAYAVKRLAVTAQGLNVATRIALPASDPNDLTKLADAGAMAYVDAIVVGAAAVKNTIAWVVEKDPAKKVWAVVPQLSPNAFFDVARAYADGATRAYLTTGDAAAIASLNRAFAGDWAYDSTAHVTTLDAKGNANNQPVIEFVRGEDLRTIVVPRGDATASTIVSLPTDAYINPKRIDAAGEIATTDVGRKGGHFLIGMRPATAPFAFAVEHNEKPQPNVTKETLNIATQRGITVEEIIRNHQAYRSYQESIQPRYVAKDTTKLRFQLAGSEAIEATIAGDFFSDPHGRADWVWSDFYINGVKWKYGRIPELPLIQPEKVTQLPLDIHLTNEYRYTLVRETDLDGYKTYEVRFEPPPNAPASLPLYRGTVWIDAQTWARIRISMVQMHMTGEVLSNEERVDFAPFARTTHTPLTPAEVAKTDAREILWLAREVNAQQVISAGGRANPVLRATTFSDFRIDPAGYDELLANASKSDARMVRETQAGLRYLEKDKSGERVVKEGFDSSRKFLLGGLHHDSGLEFPVLPLGGVDYFDFDLWHKGIQTNVFFAGIIVAANATNPNVGGTQTNIGGDVFAIAVPTTNVIYRNGIEMTGEDVRARPTLMSVRAGHPFLGFGKVDVSLGLSHVAYSRASDTDPDFLVPTNTFIVTPGVDASYTRAGYTLSGYYDFNQRTKWRPWGNLAEYDPNQKSFVDYGASLGKSFYLPKFQRLGLEVDYIGGQRLDRFSKYELGYFGQQRIHGIRSGSVRAEEAMMGHVSYGFVFSDQFRLEAFYDHGLIDDKTAGYHREPFQGVGIGGQTIGPWGTLLRLDVGKTVGRNRQTGFVANVVFLKLF
jgi:hypothetical protein